MTQVESLPSIPDYTIDEPLGNGNQSSVYLATQSSLGRQVAIKILDDADAGLLNRFDREAEIMATLSHPNLVGVIDRGSVDGQPFIVMEYMDGGTLRDRLTPQQPTPTDSARRFLEAISAGIAALHAKGLIHRDVKPDNVLFNHQGHIKVADFGIAVPQGQLGMLTQEDAAPGTVDYMAPEQRYRLEITEKADQFSLAVVAYEMLTGKLPPRVFRPASQQNKSLSPEVDSVLERALQEEPDARFSNIEEFFQTLDHALSLPAPQPAGQESSPVRLTTVGPYLLLSSIAAILVYFEFFGDSGKPSVDEAVQGQPSVVPPFEPAEGANWPEPVKIQTGALPYRITDSGNVEVLLVTARTREHWTIPKANQPDEKSFERVAEEEAFEEAGIIGPGLSQKIGSYCYRRNGRKYRVHVVPVRAIQELDEWPEQTRQRRWVSRTDAAEIIPDDVLREIVREFEPPEKS